MASTLNLVCLTLERYIAIIHPIWYKTNVTKKMVISAAGGAWIVGFIAKFANTVLTSGINYRNICILNFLWPSQTMRKSVGVIIIVITLIIPLILLIYCYTRMFISLRVRVAPTESTSNSAAKQKGSNYKATRNVFKTLITVTVCFAFCWIPNQLLLLITNLGQYNLLTTWYYRLSIPLVYLNVCCNPLRANVVSRFTSETGSGTNWMFLCDDFGHNIEC